jgi:hypothetical protein
MVGVMGSLLKIKGMVCINRFTVKAFKSWPYFKHKYEAVDYLKRRSILCKFWKIRIYKFYITLVHLVPASKFQTRCAWGHKILFPHLPSVSAGCKMSHIVHSVYYRWQIHDIKPTKCTNLFLLLYHTEHCHMFLTAKGHHQGVKPKQFSIEPN